MYYDINKIDSDKKYNIKIAEKGFGQTYYLRQKYLFMKCKGVIKMCKYCEEKEDISNRAERISEEKQLDK